MINDFFNLIFPRICGACESPLIKGEDALCIKCQFTLPKTNFHLVEENELEKIFWGRVPLVSAAAFYYFEKQGRVQNLIHNLKYRGRQDLGTKVGELFGLEIKESDSYKPIDCIIPVPLTKRKLKSRGFNQSVSFAEGLAKVFFCPVEPEVLLRANEESSQTLKSRYLRWENVSTNFVLSPSHGLNNKHVLLVDDVITTGATIEACAQELMVAGCSVSVLSMAYAKRA